MLNAANLNLIASGAMGRIRGAHGMMFAIFSIAVAAAEAAVGLGLVISIHRHAKTTDLDQMNRMKGDARGNSFTPQLTASPIAEILWLIPAVPCCRGLSRF